MSALRIGQLARLSNTPASTIRYYEQIGILPEPERVSGQRRYSPEALRQLRLIRFGREGGLTLRQIHRLLQGFPDKTPPRQRWDVVATPRIQEIDQQIAQLHSMRERLSATRDCTCASLLECAG